MQKNRNIKHIIASNEAQKACLTRMRIFIYIFFSELRAKKREILNTL